MGVLGIWEVGEGGGALLSNLGHFRNSQDCSHSKVLESTFCIDLASLYSLERRFYMIDGGGDPQGVFWESTGF